VKKHSQAALPQKSQAGAVSALPGLMSDMLQLVVKSGQSIREVFGKIIARLFPISTTS
jgi:hypothetical protein